MKTRFSSLVIVKKNAMQKSERVLQSANADFKSANVALELSYTELSDVPSPQSGQMAAMLASKTLIESQRTLIQHNKEWITFSKNQVEIAKDTLKIDRIEYEKFSYLHDVEMKKKLKELQIKEAKDLDEIALMTYTKKKVNK